MNIFLSIFGGKLICLFMLYTISFFCSFLLELHFFGFFLEIFYGYKIGSFIIKSSMVLRSYVLSNRFDTVILFEFLHLKLPFFNSFFSILSENLKSNYLFFIFFLLFSSGFIVFKFFFLKDYFNFKFFSLIFEFSS